METLDVLELFQQFTAVGRCLTAQEKRNVTKLAVALQRYQRSEFGREIVAHAQEPQIKCTCTTGGAKWFRRDSCIKASMIALTLYRNGKLRHGFLLQRGILRIDTLSGKEILKMLLGPPIGLRKGARAINVFNGAREFLGTLRAAGAKGVCITIY